jgi:hypothetical protein
MRATRILGSILIVGVAASASADATGAYERRVYTTRHCGSGSPNMDGIPNEACWAQVEWASDFVQWQPTEGDPPSEQTSFKVLYDEDAIYFAFRAHDSEPSKIVDRLERRDRFPGDWVEVNIDSYNDKRTAFSFTSSVSGTRGDEFISNDGDDWDSTWDPVWQLATNIDDAGWTAEVMIPFSQLRFSSTPEQVWGLQVQRRFFREEERSIWQPKRRDDPGWVSRFGELRGIQNVDSGTRLELLPYASARGERFETVPGDPFQDGSSAGADLGLDGKYGVTNDLTLDFTFNPDFGQVEADPSEINLTEFESFFPERRPFFIEGSNILDFQISPSIAGGGFTRDNLFYSRRIGDKTHRTEGDLNLPDGAYADVPGNTSIYAALKMSGKTESGLSIGVLESVTAKEKASTIDALGAENEQTVEPLTNFFVGRMQRDFGAGNTRLGGMFTAVNRDIDTAELDFVHTAAYSGGIDFVHQWSNKAWYVAGNSVFSRVQGEAEAIENTQTDESARYYQRPDNDYTEFDPTRTSLSGHGGSARFGRVTGSGLRFETGLSYRSPGFEINDVGFMRSADQVNQFTWVGWANRNPFSVFRRVGINTNQWLNWDYGGHPLSQQVNFNFNMNWLNNWHSGAGVTRGFERISNTALRGGPSSKWPGEWNPEFWVNSDQRKNVTINFGAHAGIGDEDRFDFWEVWASSSVRPTNAMRLSINPWYFKNDQELQYVTEAAFQGEARYLFGRLDQKTFGFTLRLDYTVTPNLTLQFYGQPFVSAQGFDEFKHITDPRASSYRDRFRLYADDEVRLNDDGVYEVDEGADNPPGEDSDYTFDDPSYNFRDFNSNLVVRWEFQPGSTLFFVWQQARQEYISQQGTFKFGNDIGGLFDVHPHNVFLFKVNKWFSL